MKTLLPLALSVAALLTFTVTLHSQAPASARQPAPAARTPLQTLQAVKARNQELLEKQAQTLILLDAMEKEADQIRIFARRT